MADAPINCWGSALLKAINAASTQRETLTALIADTGVEPDGDDMESVAKAKADEEEAMAYLQANAPKCPGCRQAFAFQRQAKRPNLCRWCGYDHDTGQQARLVPASSEVVPE